MVGSEGILEQCAAVNVNFELIRLLPHLNIQVPKTALQPRAPYKYNFIHYTGLYIIPQKLVSKRNSFIRYIPYGGIRHLQHLFPQFLLFGRNLVLKQIFQV